MNAVQRIAIAFIGEAALLFGSSILAAMTCSRCGRMGLISDEAEMGQALSRVVLRRPFSKGLILTHQAGLAIA